MSAKQMNQGQLARARKLIRAECCNYGAANNECFALDEGDGCVCVQSVSYSLLCRWFRDAVLPLDPVLEEDVFGLDNQKLCLHCRKPFVPKSNRSYLCPDCNKRQRKRQQAEFIRKKRAHVDK